MNKLLNFIRKIIKTGVHFATPVFDGAKEADIEEMLKLADLTLMVKQLYLMVLLVKHFLNK